MKTPALIVAVVATCLAIVWAGCNNSAQTHAVTYLVDTTEPHFSPASFESIQALSVLQDDAYAGEEFRIRPITELSLNAVIVEKLEAIKNPAFANDIARNDKVQQYYKKLRTALDTLQSQAQERERSIVFEAVADELTTLSKKEATYKTLVVQSDLVESSTLANFYTPEVLQQLKDNPEAVRDTFEARYPMPKLKGITIFLIHYPSSPQDNDRYSLIATQLYKPLLEKHGAEAVYISADISMAKTVMPWKP